jgi:predicted DNA-binding transcriptional regulator YafY
VESGINLAGFRRLFEIHRLVSEGAYPNCRSLADRFEVTQRTAERDIERLRDQFRVPIEYDRHRRGYYYTGPVDLPPLKLQEGEAIALFLGQRLLMQCRGTPFEEFVMDAMEKIRLLLPRSVEVSLDRALGAVSFYADPLRGEEIEVAERYQTLYRAIQNRATVSTDYFTPVRQAVTRRELDPYHLRFMDGAWYCIAYCHLRGEVRTFALDRMMNLCETAESFQIPVDFSVEDYLADSLTIERGEPKKVVIEFDPSEAPYIRGKTWHKSQVVQDLPDGSMRMTLTIGSMGEVKRWVMSLGRHAWVVEPEELREEIRRELEAARKRY